MKEIVGLVIDVRCVLVHVIGNRWIDVAVLLNFIDLALLCCIELFCRVSLHELVDEICGNLTRVFPSGAQQNTVDFLVDV